MMLFSDLECNEKLTNQLKQSIMPPGLYYKKAKRVI